MLIHLDPNWRNPLTGKIADWTGPKASVYKVMCFTSSIHKQLHGRDRGNVSSVKQALTDDYYRFRCLPAYRTHEANRQRNAVADHIRTLRKAS